MATVAANNLSAVEKEQLAISYAAFVLSGSGAEVNQESLNSVLKAANVTVSNALLGAVAKSLNGKDVTQFFGSVGGSGATTESAPVKAPEPAKGGKKQQKKVAPPPPAEDEDDGADMGGLFD